MSLRENLDRPSTYADLVLVRDDLKADLAAVVGNISGILVDRLRDVLQLRDESRDAFRDVAQRLADHERRLVTLEVRCQDCRHAPPAQEPAP